MEQAVNEAGNNGILAVCKRKKNDKSPATFYADRMIFAGETVLYSDVETINLYASSTTWNFFFESYSGYVKIALRNGKKFKWKTGGSAVFGIGGVKKKKEFFRDMYAASLSTFVNARAMQYLEQIRRGETVAIAGVTLNAQEASGKSGLKKVSWPIAELTNAEIVNGSVYIGKTGKPDRAFNFIPSNADNAICLIPLINALAAGNNQPAAQE